MTNCQFTVVIEPDEHGFHAFVPALPGCHSFGNTVEEAQANIHEALELHVEAMIEDADIQRRTSHDHRQNLHRQRSTDR